MVKAAVQIKKKRWVPVFASDEFGKAFIGEIFVVEPQDAVGRNLSVSLLSLTGDPSVQSVHVDFRISGVDGSNLTTQVIGYNIITSAVRKMMRRGKNKIEDSFVVITKDSKNVRVKPILVTKGRTKGVVLVNLQKQMRNSVIKMTRELAYSELVNSLVGHKFQRQIQDALRKTYPLSVCEIRWMSLEPEGVPIKEVEVPVAVEEEAAQA